MVVLVAIVLSIGALLLYDSRTNPDTGFAATHGINAAAWIGGCIAAAIGLIVAVVRKLRARIRLALLTVGAVVVAAVLYLVGFQVHLVGFAMVATPLSGATMNVYAVSRDGGSGQLLATTTTDTSGVYSVTVVRPPTQSLMLVTSGGAYVDQITKKSVAVGSRGTLRTVITSSDSIAELTPLTTMAAARASTLISEGDSITASIEVSNAAVARHVNLETITSLYPTDITDASDVQSTDMTSREAGLILAGIDEEANALGVSDMDLIDALAADLGDGNLDGKAGDTAVDIPPSVPLPADAADAGLQANIDKAAASPGNLSHVDAPQISTQPIQIDLNGGIYASSGALPLWIDGQFGSATIAISGGHPGYTCTLGKGVLPDGFTLDPTCTMSGTGQLQGGSVESISAPFIVNVSDSSALPQTTTVELRIHIVEAPPKVTGLTGNCPDTTTKCSVQVATATGGTKPYSFTDGAVLDGSAPLGMFLNSQTGVLSGTPATEGTYTFSVCATDLVGWEGCDNATVTVGPQPTPTPTAESTDSSSSALATPSNLPPGFPTDLPPGQYDLRLSATGVGNVDLGTQTLSSGDLSDFANAVSSAADQANGSCAGTCSVTYSGFDGTSFAITITTNDCSTGQCVTSTATITVTKVG